jgi:NAD+ synthase
MTTTSSRLETALQFDAEQERQRIHAGIRDIVIGFRRRGCVVAISGGIDSSVCAALAVGALGAGRVFGLLLPERDSSGTSTARGRMLAFSTRSTTSRRRSKRSAATRRATRQFVR